MGRHIIEEYLDEYSVDSLDLLLRGMGAPIPHETGEKRFRVRQLVNTLKDQADSTEKSRTPVRGSREGRLACCALLTHLCPGAEEGGRSQAVRIMQLGALRRSGDRFSSCSAICPSACTLGRLLLTGTRSQDSCEKCGALQGQVILSVTMTEIPALDIAMSRNAQLGHVPRCRTRLGLPPKPKHTHYPGGFSRVLTAPWLTYSLQNSRQVHGS